MAWTYEPAKIATSTLYQVRRLIGDVIQNDPQLQDEEIAFALTQRSSIYGAAADCARMLAGQFSRRATTSVTGMNVQFSNQAIAYSKLADQFETLANARGGALPYAGGISVTDKQNQEADTDRVGGQYAIGMDDDYFPVGTREVPETQQ